MSEIALENNLTNNITNENEQKSFLETTIGKAVNTGLDIGIRYLLPDLVEEQVIDIKDSFLKNGFKEGIQTAIDSAINLGKSALGIVTGNFENINQMQTAVKNGGIIDSVSNVLNSVINKVVDNGVISNSVGNVIKNGKNALLNNITKNIESEFENQVNNIEKLERYTAAILKNIEAFNRFDIQPLVEQNNQEMLTRIMVLKDSNRVNVSEIGYGAQYNMLIVLSILEKIINYVKKMKDDEKS